MRQITSLESIVMSQQTFLLACKNGDVATVRQLLPTIDINAIIPLLNEEDEYLQNGVTPLIMACYMGQLDVIKLLLADERIEINKKLTFTTSLKFLPTAFHFACIKRSMPVLNLLLQEKQLDINVTNSSMFLPEHPLTNNVSTVLGLLCMSAFDESFDDKNPGLESEFSFLDVITRLLIDSRIDIKTNNILFHLIDFYENQLNEAYFQQINEADGIFDEVVLVPKPKNTYLAIIKLMLAYQFITSDMKENNTENLLACAIELIPDLNILASDMAAWVNNFSQNILSLIIDDMPQQIKNMYFEKCRPAAELFGLMVWICDDFLKLPEKTTSATEKPVRFLKIACQLPMDLQMTLARIAHGSGAETIPTELIDETLKKQSVRLLG